jgi:hypothetical protein
MIEYEKLPTSCICSQTTIAAAVMKLGPARIYYLHVNPKAEWDAKVTLKIIGADTSGNPLSPYLNLILDSECALNEWFVTEADRAVGSEGC